MAGPDEHAPFQKVFESVLPCLASLLEQSRAVHLALLDGGGVILHVNRAMAEVLDRGGVCPAGKLFGDFLIHSDSTLLAGYLEGGIAIPESGFVLNVAAGVETPRSLRCRLVRDDAVFLLIGEPPLDAERLLLEELIQLNGQLTVMSRENARKGRELAQALANLKKTQTMMLHAEKMASLGQMTAGIAHEINNPIAFVLNNEHVLKRDFGAVLLFMDALNGMLPALEKEAPHLHAELADRALRLELDYLKGAIPRKIAANIDGLERIRDIVRDLRIFSRLDEAERMFYNLSEGIEASLRFLKPLLLEQGVSVETSLADLPPLFCAPGPLNQAISNILINAIQASHSGQAIRISTRRDSEWAVIEIADQGEGINPEHLGKVFDPFFTTKAVGSGTGLGLSIALQVVESHRGRIEIAGHPGAGTSVSVILPAITDKELADD